MVWVPDKYHRTFLRVVKFNWFGAFINWVNLLTANWTSRCVNSNIGEIPLASDIMSLLRLVLDLRTNLVFESSRLKIVSNWSYRSLTNDLPRIVVDSSVFFDLRIKSGFQENKIVLLSFVRKILLIFLL